LKISRKISKLTAKHLISFKAPARDPGRRQNGPDRRLSGQSFSPSIHNVKKGQDRMTVDHPGTGIPHDLPDPFAHDRFIAMDRASGAGRLFCPEGTLLEPLVRIILKGAAFRTDFILRSMPITAIDADHRLKGLPFPGDPAGLICCGQST
jgi:hypothetical protein